MTDTYPPALPWAAQLDADDLEGFLADLAEAASGDDDLATLAEVESAIARHRAIGEAAEAHRNAPGPDTARSCGCMPQQRFACGHCPHDLCQDCERCCSCHCADIPETTS